MNRLFRRLAPCLPALLALPPAGAAPQKPPNVGVSGHDYTVTLPDPKMPTRPQIVAHIRDFNGQITDATLFGVYARLYRQGLPSAVLSAPRAVLTNRKDAQGLVMTATGGVVVKSLTQAGTRLSSDTMVWHARQNKIVALGHVFYKDGKNGGTVTGPYGVWDTKTQGFSTRGPGRASASF